MVKIGGPGLTREAYYDRNPGCKNNMWSGTVTAGSGWIVRWSYTVPAGKKFFVAYTMVRIATAIATAGMAVIVNHTVDIGAGGKLFASWVHFSTVDSYAIMSTPCQFMIGAGDSLEGKTRCTDTVGHGVNTSVIGTEFDE